MWITLSNDESCSQAVDKHAARGPRVPQVVVWFWRVGQVTLVPCAAPLQAFCARHCAAALLQYALHVLLCANHGGRALDTRTHKLQNSLARGGCTQVAVRSMELPRNFARAKAIGADPAAPAPAPWPSLPARILQNIKSCGLSVPRFHESPSPTAAGARRRRRGGCCESSKTRRVSLRTTTLTRAMLKV